MTIKNDELRTMGPFLIHSVHVLLMASQSIVYDATMTKQLWHDHMESNIELVRYRFYSRLYSRPVV